MRTLEEAVAARRAAEQAGDTTAWVRARALEEFLQGRGGGEVHVFDTKLHPRDREGKFRELLGHLKVGDAVHLPHGVKVHKVGAGRFEVHGGVEPQARKVRGTKYTARDALERHDLVRDAITIGKLNPGEEHRVGGHAVAKRGTKHVVYPKLPATDKNPETKLGDVPELETEHDSAIEAARHARKRAIEVGDVPVPSRRSVLKSKAEKPEQVASSHWKAEHHEKVEKVDQLTRDAYGDVEPVVFEKIPFIGEKLKQGEEFLFGPGAEGAKGGVEHVGGHADPGVGAHLAAAQHGHQIADHAVGRAHEFLAQAAPHVGTGKHRAALKGAHHVVQHMAAAHGGDIAHTVGHVLSHLFTSRYDDAKAARAAATNSTEWTRARMLEEFWKARLEEIDRGNGGDSLRAPDAGRAGVRASGGAGHAVVPLEDVSRLAEAVGFNPSLHPRNRRGTFIDSLHKMQPADRKHVNGFTIQWLPPINRDPTAVGDPNPENKVKGVYKITMPDGQVTSRKEEKDVADVVGAPGAGKGNPEGVPVEDMETALRRMIGGQQSEGKQGRPKGGKATDAWTWGGGPSDYLAVISGQRVKIVQSGPSYGKVGTVVTKNMVMTDVRLSDGKTVRIPNLNVRPHFDKAELGTGHHLPFTDDPAALDRAGEADVGGRGERNARGLLSDVIRAKDPKDIPQSVKDEVIDRLGRADVGIGKKGSRNEHKLLARAIHDGIGQPPKGKADPGFDVAGPPDMTAPVNIGVTPYRGPGKPPEADIAGYYDTPRYKQFKSKVRADAQERGLKVTNFAQVAGLWDGNKEPAVSVTVCCDADAAEDMARSLGERYNQDGVMTFTSDPGGGAFLYRTADKVDTAKALEAMKAHGVLGGRIQGGKLEVIDPDGQAADAVFKIADDLGVDFHYDVGRAKLLEKGTDYLAVGEAEVAPAHEADAREGQAQGHDDHATRQGARGVVEAYVASKHPRDRLGRWVDVLAKLKLGETYEHEGVTVKRHQHSGHFEVSGGHSAGSRFAEKPRAAAHLLAHAIDGNGASPPSVERFLRPLPTSGKGKVKERFAVYVDGARVGEVMKVKMSAGRNLLRDSLVWVPKPGEEKPAFSQWFETSREAADWVVGAVNSRKGIHPAHAQQSPDWLT